MKIKIDAKPDHGSVLTEASHAAIQEALDAKNGKATAFTIHDANHVARLVEKVDIRLRAAGITEAEALGTVVTYRPKGPSANSYKNSAISTLLTIQKTRLGWHLVGVERVKVYPRNAERLTVHAKDNAVMATAHRLMKSISTNKFEILRPAVNA